MIIMDPVFKIEMSFVNLNSKKKKYLRIAYLKYQQNVKVRVIKSIPRNNKRCPTFIESAELFPLSIFIPG